MHSETMWTWNQVEIPEVIFEQEGGHIVSNKDDLGRRADR